MKDTYNLTEAPITTTLIKLAWPIIATNFIQTAYGIVDMIWVGRLGSDSVAAIGTASFFINLANGLFAMISIGSGVKVSHSIGAKDEKKTREYIHNGFLMSVLLALFYMVFILLTKEDLIGFFGMKDPTVERMAEGYLVITITGLVFTFFNTLLSMVLNSMGNSIKPFRINMAGFIVNILFDPLFIFGIGPVDGFGVYGASLATVVSNILVTALFIHYTKSSPFFTRPFFLNLKGMMTVIKMGLPITVQRVTFQIIGIIIAKIIVQWGPEAIAVQRVGIQIESVSFMTAAGLQGAVAALIGQNFGAGLFARIRKGYRTALFITFLFGSVISTIFVVFPKPIFSIFLSDSSSLELGVYYLQIIGFSQLFMCLEIMTVGAFNGIGKTYIPPIFSIILTALRIPMALGLSRLFGLNGVWMAIAISSILKGVVLVSWFILTTRRMNRTISEKNMNIIEGRLRI